MTVPPTSAQPDRQWSEDDITQIVLGALRPMFDRAGVDVASIQPDDDLYASGVVDSYDVVEAMAEVEEKTGLAGRLAITGNPSEFALSLRQLVGAFRAS